MFFDYADSGAWTEQTYHANESDFAKILLRQRILDWRPALADGRLATAALHGDMASLTPTASPPGATRTWFGQAKFTGSTPCSTSQRLVSW